MECRPGCGACCVAISISSPIPGMPGGNMQQLMRQAQKMQEQLAKTQEALDEKEYEASSGGGMVTCKVSGKREVTSLVIKPEAVDPDDVEMLEDLVKAAVNEALRVEVPPERGESAAQHGGRVAYGGHGFAGRQGVGDQVGQPVRGRPHRGGVGGDVGAGAEPAGFAGGDPGSGGLGSFEDLVELGAGRLVRVDHVVP